jgi:spore maturation protein CgeB
VKIFVFGSSIVSSYWNGAATYYRGIYKYLARRGHQITFAEPDAYQRQDHRDPGDYSWVRSMVYQPHVDIERMLEAASGHDVIIKHSGVGADDALLESSVPSLKTGNRAIIFWDVDAPATIGRLHADPGDPFHADIPRYDAILTYGGGPAVRRNYLALGAHDYYSIYNGLDPETHFPVPADPSLACDVAFLGNRLPDREERVCELFLRAAELAPAKEFLLGGEGWGDKPMPRNVRWIGHVPTGDHNRVNCSAGMVMNINRSSMANVGFSPPTRIFEAAGCGACLLCDEWPGIGECFTPGNEILVIRSAEDVVDALERYGSGERKRIGDAFHARALREHTYAGRAERTEQVFLACLHRQDQTKTVAPFAVVPVGGPA